MTIFLRLLLQEPEWWKGTTVAAFMIICLQYRQIVLNTGKLLRVGQKNDKPNFSRSLRWPLTSIEQTFSTDIWKYDTSLYSLTEAIEPEQLDNRSRERKLFRSESRFSNYIIAIPALHYHFNCLSLCLLLDRSFPLCGAMDTVLCLFPKYSKSKNLIIHYFTIIKAQKLNKWSKINLSIPQQTNGSSFVS